MDYRQLAALEESMLVLQTATVDVYCAKRLAIRAQTDDLVSLLVSAPWWHLYATLDDVP